MGREGKRKETYDNGGGGGYRKVAHVERKEKERKMDRTQQKEVMRQTIPVNVLA